MKIDRTYNAVRNILFGLISKIYQTLMPFFMRCLIIHKMSVEYLGLNSLFTSVIQVLSLAELGVGSAMIYSMYQPIADDDHKKICALMDLYRKYYFWIGIAVAVMGMAVLPILPDLIKSDLPADINLYVLYAMNLAAAVMSYWLFAYRNSILQAHQRLDVASKVIMFTDTVKYFLQIIAILIFRDYYMYSIAIFSTQILSNLMTAYIAKKMYPDLDPHGDLDISVIKDIKQRIKDIFTSKLGAVVVNSADSIVISAFLGLTALAVYQNYFYIISIVFAFIMVCLDSCVAGIGNSLVTESIDKNYRDFKGLSFVTNWICCVCVCCFLNLFTPFMKMYAGDGYTLPNIYVLLFCIYFYLYTLTNYWCIYKNASGIWHEDRFRPLVGASLNLALNLLTVRYWGLYAILLSTVISYVLVMMPWLVINLYKLLFKRSPKGYIFKLVKSLCSITICATVSFIACTFVKAKGFTELILKGSISTIIGGLLYGMIYVKTEEFRYFSDFVMKIARNKIAFKCKRR